MSHNFAAVFLHENHSEDTQRLVLVKDCGIE